jgi:hypothetical protein
MTYSLTRSGSDSFTITDARHVGAKVGADLRMIANLYGKPALTDIDDYVEEVALLLRDGHLGTVDYGFKQVTGNAWRLRLRYTATAGGHLVDNRPGSFPSAVAVAGLPFLSFLTYSANYLRLTAEAQQRIKAVLPVQRTTGVEPTATAGIATAGHGYARNGIGVDRSVYVAN